MARVQALAHWQIAVGWVPPISDAGSGGFIALGPLAGADCPRRALGATHRRVGRRVLWGDLRQNQMLNQSASSPISTPDIAYQHGCDDDGGIS